MASRYQPFAENGKREKELHTRPTSPSSYAQQSAPQRPSLYDSFLSIFWPSRSRRRAESAAFARRAQREQQSHDSKQDSLAVSSTPGPAPRATQLARGGVTPLASTSMSSGAAFDSGQLTSDTIAPDLSTGTADVSALLGGPSRTASRLGYLTRPLNWSGIQAETLADGDAEEAQMELERRQDQEWHQLQSQARPLDQTQDILFRTESEGNANQHLQQSHSHSESQSRETAYTLLGHFFSEKAQAQGPHGPPAISQEERERCNRLLQQCQGSGEDRTLSTLYDQNSQTMLAGGSSLFASSDPSGRPRIFSQERQIQQTSMTPASQHLPQVTMHTLPGQRRRPTSASTLVAMRHPPTRKQDSHLFTPFRPPGVQEDMRPKRSGLQLGMQLGSVGRSAELSPAHVRDMGSVDKSKSTPLSVLPPPILGAEESAVAKAAFQPGSIPPKPVSATVFKQSRPTVAASRLKEMLAETTPLQDAGAQTSRSKVAKTKLAKPYATLADLDSYDSPSTAQTQSEAEGATKKCKTEMVQREMHALRERQQRHQHLFGQGHQGGEIRHPSQQRGATTNLLDLIHQTAQRTEAESSQGARVTPQKSLVASQQAANGTLRSGAHSTQKRSALGVESKQEEKESLSPPLQPPSAVPPRKATSSAPETGTRTTAISPHPSPLQDSVRASSVSLDRSEDRAEDISHAKSKSAASSITPNLFRPSNLAPVLSSASASMPNEKPVFSSEAQPQAPPSASGTCIPHKPTSTTLSAPKLPSEHTEPPKTPASTLAQARAHALSTPTSKLPVYDLHLQLLALQSTSFLGAIRPAEQAAIQQVLATPWEKVEPLLDLRGDVKAPRTAALSSASTPKKATVAPSEEFFIPSSTIPISSTPAELRSVAAPREKFGHVGAGEESERTLGEARVKAMALLGTASGKPDEPQWTNVGVGFFRVNQGISRVEKVRALMRSEGNSHVLINFALYPDLAVRRPDATILAFLGFDGQGRPTQYRLRFKTFQEASVVEQALQEGVKALESGGSSRAQQESGSKDDDEIATKPLDAAPASAQGGVAQPISISSQTYNPNLATGVTFAPTAASINATFAARGTAITDTSAWDEEDSGVVAEARSKVYKRAGTGWSHVGTGSMKVTVLSDSSETAPDAQSGHKNHERARLLLRSEPANHVLVNFLLYRGMGVKLGSGAKTLSFVGFEGTAPAAYRVRFQTAEQAQLLKEAIEMHTP